MSERGEDGHAKRGWLTVLCSLAPFGSSAHSGAAGSLFLCSLASSAHSPSCSFWLWLCYNSIGLSVGKSKLKLSTNLNRIAGSILRDSAMQLLHAQNSNFSSHSPRESW